MFGDRAFQNIAPDLWNSLPQYLREIDNLDSFKTQLKTQTLIFATFQLVTCTCIILVFYTHRDSIVLCVLRTVYYYYYYNRTMKHSYDTKFIPIKLYTPLLCITTI